MLVTTVGPNSLQSCISTWRRAGVFDLGLQKFPYRPTLQGPGCTVLFCSLSLLSTHSFSLLFLHWFWALWSTTQVVPCTGLEKLSLRLLTPGRGKRGKVCPVYYCNKCPILFISTGYPDACFFCSLCLRCFIPSRKKKPCTNVNLF